MIMRAIQRVLPLFVALFAFLGVSNIARAQKAEVPRAEIDSWLKAAIKENGGNWDKGRYAFYVAFQTSQNAQEADLGNAMKYFAFDILNNSLAVGDKVIAVGYEMQSTPFNEPIQLTDDPGTRQKFVDEIPQSTQPGSHGGHDIDRAMIDAIKQIPSNEANSSIILVLSKDGASQMPQGSAGSRLVGEESAEFKSAKLANGYQPHLNKEQFTISTGGVNKQVHVTALFPKKLTSLASDGTSRYPTFPRETWVPKNYAPDPGEKLPNDTKQQSSVTQPVAPKTINTAEHDKGGIPIWVWIILALIIIGVIVFMMIGKKSGVQKPLKPVAGTPQVTKIETIPGSLRVTIGADEQMLSPLPKAGKWTISKSSEGVVSLTEDALPPVATIEPGTSTTSSTQTATIAGTVLARLIISEDRSLKADAEAGAQFAEIQGTAGDRSNSRSLNLEPGKRVLCRLLSADGSSKTRVEIVYDTQTGKGSKTV